MQKIILLQAIVFLALNSSAQKKVEVKSDVKTVTVYLSGAEVNRTASTALTTGNQDVVFTGLPVNVNQQTINVSAEDKLIIQSVQFKLNYLAPEQISAENKKWRDSLESVNQELEIVSDKKELMLMQQAMLDENKKTTGANTGLNFEAVKLYYEFMTTKEWELKEKWQIEERKEKLLREAQTRLNQQLYNFNLKKSQPSGEVWVQVTADKNMITKFTLSYLVNNAGWNPEYDIRADKVNAPITLNYKAAIWQTTGEDWKDISLKLSTGNPTAGAAGPVFTTWFLDYYYGTYTNDEQTINLNGARNYSQKYYIDGVPMKEGDLKPSSAIEMDKKSETGSQYTQVTESTLSTEFDIKLPSTIPSGTEVHRVNIGDYSMDASYDYYSIPHLDPDVFLNAHIADWEKLNLLDGPASVFFQGAYVGQSYIDANQTADTLELSLGRDKNIIITREKLKDFTKEKLIGDRYRQSVTYEIKLKNTEATEVKVDVIEQMPISANNDIKITIDDLGGADYNAELGKLLWKQTLAPGEEKKMRFSITVEFDASKSRHGKNKVYSPRF